jgi:dienelactone hydrolase
VARGALALLFVIGAYLSLIPQGRAVARSSLLLTSFITASQPAPLVLNGEPIRHTTRTISSQAGPVYLDIYEPTTPTPPVPGAREGLLVIPGVGDERKEPQLINFSESVARSGLVVMDITTDTLIGNALSPADSDAVVQAYLTLEHWPGVTPTRIGILGFSAGDALACLAAADPRIRDTVAFVTSFGGYFNAETLLTDVGQRGQLVDGRFQSWKPNGLPLQVLANSIASTLPSDQASLLADAFALNATPLTPAQIASFSPPAAAAYHLLAGDEPQRVQDNVVALSPDMHALLAALSPSAVVTRVKAPIYLFHDQTDPYVPFTQSRSFNDALNQLGHPHQYAELTIFAHTEVKSGLSIGPVLRDGSALFNVLIGLLQPAS